MRLADKVYLEARRRYGHGYQQRRIDLRIMAFGATLVSATIMAGGIPQTWYASEVKVFYFHSPQPITIDGRCRIRRWAIVWPKQWHEVLQPETALRLRAFRVGFVGDRIRRPGTERTP